MTVIVEDGSIVSDANSYVTLVEVRAYAAERGIELPAEDTDLEPKLHMAMDWFEGNEFPWPRSTTEQTTAFPRIGVTLDGVVFNSDEVPALVGKVVMQATCDAVTIELEPSYAGSGRGQLQKKKLDVMEKVYFKSEWATEQPRLTKLMKMIAPLLGGGLTSGQLKVNRV